jgi:hypothetical protein
MTIRPSAGADPPRAARIARARRRRRAFCAVAALSLGILVAAGKMPIAVHTVIGASCADEDDEAESRVHAPSRVRVVNGRTELVLSPAAVNNAGILTARPAAAPERAQLQAYGEVLDAATLTGLASRYRNAAAQATAAQARVSASRAALARARALYRDRQNISAAQLQAAESAFQSDAAQLGAAQSSLSALGATLAQSAGPVLARAMRRDSMLFESLVSRRDYLIAVTLPPGVVPARPPPTALARLPNGASLTLQLISPGVAANPLVQGLRYYYRASAAPGLLAGLNLPVVLANAGAARAALVVPESAVVWLQGKPWIYRLTNSAPHSVAQVFVREPIDPQRQTGDGGYVVAGFSPDAQIVIRGAQLLLSEEFRAQVEAEASD